MIQGVISQGWECPKCGKVYAPTQLECTKCPIPETYTSTGNVHVNGTTSTTYIGHEFVSISKGTSKTRCAVCGLEKWQHPNISYT